jgi:hypothetical protein
VPSTEEQNLRIKRAQPRGKRIEVSCRSHHQVILNPRKLIVIEGRLRLRRLATDKQIHPFAAGKFLQA